MRGASIAAGLDEDAARTIIRRPGNSPSARTLAKLAQVAQTSVDYLVGLTDHPGRDVQVQGLALPVMGRVQAGWWSEPDSEASEPRMIEVEPATRFPGAPQWLEQVEGDSMNHRYPPGSLVRVVDAAAIGYLPRHGDDVVIERRRAGLVERSLKQLVIRVNGEIEAWARSHNPRWVEPLSFGQDGEEEEVRVIGLVLRGYILP